jgi:hypothetical protein
MYFSFTFHWPPSFGSTFTPFSFFLKGELGSLGALSFPDIIFNSTLRILVPTSFLRRKEMIILGNWEKEGE